VYADPGLRPFGDLDLLVATPDYERACAILADLGCERLRPEPRAHWEVRFGKASVHRHPDDEVEIDLHRTLVLGPFGLWLDPEELLHHAVPFELGGRKLLRLDDTGMFVSVALHAALGFDPPRLTPLRDVIQLASSEDLDVDRLHRWQRRWHLTAVVAEALKVATRTLGVDLPAQVQGLMSASAPARETQLLLEYQGTRRSRGGMAIATLSAIPRVRDKAAYAMSLVFPDREFLRYRGLGGRRLAALSRLKVPARWALQPLTRDGHR
jgi:hypothetical protein